MDIFFPISIFRLYPGLMLQFKHNSASKNPFSGARFCEILDFFYLRQTKDLKMMESMVLVTRTWS